MKTKVLALTELWSDFFIAAGIVALSGVLGFYAREFALMTQASLFIGDWGVF